MSCQEIVEVITEYIELTLSEPDRSRFEEHLRVCGPCTTYLEQMRLTIQLVGRIQTDTIPPKNQQDLLLLFRDWKASRA